MRGGVKGKGQEEIKKDPWMVTEKGGINHTQAADILGKEYA